MMLHGGTPVRSSRCTGFTAAHGAAAGTRPRRVTCRRLVGYSIQRIPGYHVARLSGKGRRAKGARGERMLRDILRRHGWPGAERGQQRHGGPDSPDVRGGPPGYHFEAKFVEALNVRSALAQAQADAGAAEVAIVAHKRSSQAWVAILDLEALLGLLRELELRRMLD